MGVRENHGHGLLSPTLRWLGIPILFLLLVPCVPLALGILPPLADPLVLESPFHPVKQKDQTQQLTISVRLLYL